MKNIRIREIAEYHPKNVGHVENYIEHFKAQGKDVKNLLKVIYGRKSYYLVNNEGKAEEECENSLTMKIAAATRLLEKAKLTAKDIDALIVATQVPEHTSPPDSILVHKALDMRQDTFVYDVNSNCASMLTGLEQAYYYMEINPSLQRVMLLGGDYMSLMPREDQELIYGCLGDAACGIILERSEDSESKLIATNHFINNEFAQRCYFPQCGLSNILKGENILSVCLPVGADVPIVIDKIASMLKDNGLSVSDISSFCLSQFVYANINQIKRALSIPDEKCPYIGDVYGYTGVTSPFLALNRAVQDGKVKQGDYVFFWTIGNGMQHIFIIIKY